MPWSRRATLDPCDDRIKGGGEDGRNHHPSVPNRLRCAARVPYRLKCITSFHDNMASARIVPRTRMPTIARQGQPGRPRTGWIRGFTVPVGVREPLRRRATKYVVRQQSCRSAGPHRDGTSSQTQHTGARASKCGQVRTHHLASTGGAGSTE